MIRRLRSKVGQFAIGGDRLQLVETVARLHVVPVLEAVHRNVGKVAGRASVWADIAHQSIGLAATTFGPDFVHVQLEKQAALTRTAGVRIGACQCIRLGHPGPSATAEPPDGVGLGPCAAFHSAIQRAQL